MQDKLRDSGANARKCKTCKFKNTYLGVENNPGSRRWRRVHVAAATGLGPCEVDLDHPARVHVPERPASKFSIPEDLGQIALGKA